MDMDPDVLRERQFRRAIGVVAAVLVLFLAAGYALSRIGRGRRGATLLLIPADGKQSASAGARGAGSVFGAPAVDRRQIDRRLLESGAVTGGELEVSLAWNSLSDFDLEVRDPTGALVNAHQPRSPSGGVQDVDANPTLITGEGQRLVEQGRNPGPENVTPLPDFLVDVDQQLPPGMRDLIFRSGSEGKAPSRFTRRPIEHVYYSRPPKGVYTVYGRCYSWREPNGTPQPFTVQVRTRGQVFHETSGTLGPQSYITHNLQPSQLCQFVVQ